MSLRKQVRSPRGAVVAGKLAHASGAELHPGVAATLETWRCKAADILLSVVAGCHLPVIILGWLGHGPPLALLPKAIGLAVYLVIAAAAVFRWVDYRARILVSMVALYPALGVASVCAPNGPYSQIGVVVIPLFALVLLGTFAGRIAVVASTGIIVTAPFLRAQPVVVHLLGVDPTLEVASPGLVWFRATVKAACLFGLMILLDRFYRLLLDTLTQRIAAQRKVEDEMNERQLLAREIASVSDKERCRLGQELHDGVCQQVTAALLRSQALTRRLQRGGVLSDADIEPLTSLLAQAIEDAHHVASGLCPLDSAPEALTSALRALTKRMQEVGTVLCEFRCIGDVRVADPTTAQNLYRIAQEALSNAVRHASPRCVAIVLRRDDGWLTLQIEDDGIGMPDLIPGGGMGLRTMAYRAQMLQGQLVVEPLPGGGTRVSCRIPVDRAPTPGHYHERDKASEALNRFAAH